MLLAQGTGLHSKATRAKGEQRLVSSGKGGLSLGGLEPFGMEMPIDQGRQIHCGVCSAPPGREARKFCFGRRLKGSHKNQKL